jgi:hypothetical protein
VGNPGVYALFGCGSHPQQLHHQLLVLFILVPVLILDLLKLVLKIHDTREGVKQLLLSIVSFHCHLKKK